MTQQQVLDYLKEKDGWIDYNEIVLGLGIGKISVLRCLRVLRNSGDVFFKEIKVGGNKQYIYSSKY